MTTLSQHNKFQTIIQALKLIFALSVLLGGLLFLVSCDDNNRQKKEGFGPFATGGKNKRVLYTSRFMTLTNVESLANSRRLLNIVNETALFKVTFKKCSKITQQNFPNMKRIIIEWIDKDCQLGGQDLSFHLEGRESITIDYAASKMTKISHNTSNLSLVHNDEPLAIDVEAEIKFFPNNEFSFFQEIYFEKDVLSTDEDEDDKFHKLIVTSVGQGLFAPSDAHMKFTEISGDLSFNMYNKNKNGLKFIKANHNQEIGNTKSSLGKKDEEFSDVYINDCGGSTGNFKLISNYNNKVEYKDILVVNSKQHVFKDGPKNAKGKTLPLSWKKIKCEVEDQYFYHYILSNFKKLSYYRDGDILGNN